MPKKYINSKGKLDYKGLGIDYLINSKEPADAGGTVTQGLSTGERIHNAISDIGTGVATWGTSLRPPNQQEIKQGRGDWGQRSKLLANSATQGIANELVGGAMSKGSELLFNSKVANSIKEAAQGVGTKVLGLRTNNPALNETIHKEFNNYIELANDPRNLERLKNIDKEYGTSLLERHNYYTDYVAKNQQPGNNTAIYAANPGGSALGMAGPEVGGIPTAVHETIYKAFTGKGSPYALDNSYHAMVNNSISNKEVAGTVSHETSHVLNKGGQMFSKALDDEYKAMFRDLKAVNPYDHYGDYDVSGYSTAQLDKMMKDEYKYYTEPTESQAFLFTNVREDFVKNGVLKDHYSELTRDALDNAIDNRKVGELSRFRGFLKKDEFIKMFNKMPYIVGAPLAVKAAMKQESPTDSSGKPLIVYK
jgi:hypothetical protein